MTITQQIQSIVKSISGLKQNKNQQVLLASNIVENKSGGVAIKTNLTDIVRYMTDMWKRHLEANGLDGKDLGLIAFGELIVKANKFSDLYPGFQPEGLQRKASFQSKALRVAFALPASDAPFAQKDLLSIFQAMATTLPGVTRRAEVKVVKKADVEAQKTVESGKTRKANLTAPAQIHAQA
jgi:hypothetical protein